MNEHEADRYMSEMQAKGESERAELEAVAEALWRDGVGEVYRDKYPWGCGSTEPDAPDEERYRHQARVAVEAALAASRQPVSGGLEGDVEAALLWLRTKAFTAAPDIRIHAVALLAALSRVPADGEQPAGESVVEVRVDSFCEWLASEVGLTDPQMESVRESLAMVASPPADGPVSASRPPEAGLEALTDLYDAIQPRDGSMPDMDTIRLIAELRYPELRAGLGDRQLTAALNAMADELEAGFDADEIAGKLRRLASGENPDR